MRKIQAVIGANFGDEGKGRTVDMLVNKARAPLVIRANSGAQAGHTVVVGDDRHVFSHFGAGTLRGASTYLCHKFVVNPIFFNHEYDIIKSLLGEKQMPAIYVDANCMMSSPLDVILNQATELSRGENRHGSVGAGFGETIDRHLKNVPMRFRTTRRDLLQQRLQFYFANTLNERKIDRRLLPDKIQDYCDRIFENNFRWGFFWDQYDLMMSRIRIVPNPAQFLTARSADCRLIFEGAQGLGLHQDDGIGAPDHATWCRTGVEDIVELIDQTGLDAELEAFYVSRTYLTRHGAGPFADHPDLSYEDPTNKPNEWQGALRFAPFDMQFTDSLIIQDLQRYMNMDSPTKLIQRTVLTCADQLPSFAEEIRDWADYIGWGPSSDETEANTGRSDN